MSGASRSQVDLVGVPLDAATPAFFRYRKAGEMVVLTNQDGSFLVLSPGDFLSFATGGLVEGDPLWERLREGNFLARSFDREKAVERLRARKGFLYWGPGRHSVAVTGAGAAMTAATVEQVVDLALASSSPAATFAFRAGAGGGDPLGNLAVIRHAVDTARERNTRAGKELAFAIDSDLSLLTDEALALLLDGKFVVRARVTGRASDGADDRAARGIERIGKAYRDSGLDPAVFGVEAHCTVRRADLAGPVELVDSFVRLGCQLLFLAPDASLAPAEFLPFHRAVLEHLVDLARNGTVIRERRTAVFLAKILTGEDPGFLEIRSPGGEGIGMLAYGPDGAIATDDEGLDLHAAGDETFCLGNVATSSYREVVGHDTVRAVVLATNGDARPDCVNCAYVPYCGVPAAAAYRAQGTIFGRMRENALCALYKGIQDDLFARIGSADPVVLKVFRAWAAAESGGVSGDGWD